MQCVTRRSCTALLAHASCVSHGRMMRVLVHGSAPRKERAPGSGCLARRQSLATHGVLSKMSGSRSRCFLLVLESQAGSSRYYIRARSAPLIPHCPARCGLLVSSGGMARASMTSVELARGQPVYAPWFVLCTQTTLHIADGLWKNDSPNPGLTTREDVGGRVRFLTVGPVGTASFAPARGRE